MEKKKEKINKEDIQKVYSPIALIMSTTIFCILLGNKKVKIDRA